MEITVPYCGRSQVPLQLHMTVRQMLHLIQKYLLHPYSSLLWKAARTKMTKKYGKICHVTSPVWVTLFNNKTLLTAALMAGMGPVPITEGSTPACAHVTILTNGARP